jgi:hypothetical protein
MDLFPGWLPTLGGLFMQPLLLTRILPPLLGGLKMDAADAGRERSENALVIGWRLARDLRTEWWDHQKSVSLGAQPPHMLERIDPQAVAMHTAVIAQSGSGKSFFLGRYLEEVVLRTEARVTIFDPNADFRRFYETNDRVWSCADEWTSEDPNGIPRGPSGDPITHESDIDAFRIPWSRTNQVVTGGFNSVSHNEAARVKIACYHWPSLSVSLIQSGISSSELRTGIAVLHRYIKAANILWEHLPTSASPPARVPPFPALETWLHYAKHEVETNDRGRLAGAMSQIREALGLPTEVECKCAIETAFEAALHLASKVTPEAREQYLKKFHAIEQRGRLVSNVSSMINAFGQSPSVDVRVLDFPSFIDSEEKDFATLYLLDAIWHEARTSWEEATRDEATNSLRRPHIIVADEAHNLVPSDRPDSPVRADIRDRIKTIAGEGRKYGLFLVLVSQRPDKIDSQVLSECGNQAIMLVRSTSVLEQCKVYLGVDLTADERDAIVRDFRSGYVRLSGKWSPRPRMLFVAARRTVTGGKDLDPSWAKGRASLFSPPPAPASKPPPRALSLTRKAKPKHREQPPQEIHVTQRAKNVSTSGSLAPRSVKQPRRPKGDAS